MKLKEIARELFKYLAEFERLENIEHKGDRRYLGRYYNVNVWSGGRFVYVKYISYQIETAMTKSEATEYLEWLRAGNSGRHYEMIRAGEAANGDNV